MTVKAIDKDENENGRLTYHFKMNDENVQETEEFSINPNTGELRTKLSLDRETKSKYEVHKNITLPILIHYQTIKLILQKNILFILSNRVFFVCANIIFFFQLVLVARDHGSPKWYETIRHLTVLLVDENDNRPEFPGSKSTNPYHFYVTENNERNILIGKNERVTKRYV